MEITHGFAKTNVWCFNPAGFVLKIVMFCFISVHRSLVVCFCQLSSQSKNSLFEDSAILNFLIGIN